MAPIEEILLRLLHAQQLLTEIDPARFVASVERQTQAMSDAFKAELEKGQTSTSDSETFQQALSQFEQMRRPAAQAISDMAAKCETLLSALDGVAGQPEAEAVFLERARHLQESAVSISAFVFLMEQPPELPNDPAGRAAYSRAMESIAAAAADVLGRNWGEEVVPEWMELLFDDVLEDDSGESLGEMLKQIGVKDEPEARSAFYNMKTRPPVEGSDPNWRQKAAKDPGKFLCRGLAKDIRSGANDQKRESHVKRPPEEGVRKLRPSSAENPASTIDRRRRIAREYELLDTFIRDEATEEERAILERLFAGAGPIEAAGGSKGKWQALQRKLRRRRAAS